MERILIPHACLVAILLVVRSSSGTNFVFHYPPDPNSESALESRLGSKRTGSDRSSTDSSSSPNSSDDEIDAPESGPETRKYDQEADPSESDKRSRSYVGRQSRRLRQDHEDDDEEDDENVKSEPTGPPWEYLFGYKTKFLASLLAPKGPMCKTKFELTIDDLIFLGHPAQIKPNGTWKKMKRRKGRSKRTADSEHVSVHGEEVNMGEDADDENDGFEEDDGRSEASERKDGLTMFHVVFVMNPPELEYHSRVQDMYSCVVKKFSKALKLEQARSDYVGRQTEIILQLRERASHDGTTFLELWNLILSKSNLANAIAVVYTSIAASKIAHVCINDSIDLSLQIPIIHDTPFLPSYIEPQMPGLHLTTASSLGDDDFEQDNVIARHFTLLLLDEKETIEKEIEKEISSDPANTNSNLLYFVRNLHPTMSFVQLATACQLSLPEIQVLACHLIYWRRARAVPPLRTRDYYIVSPNADMKKLSTQIPIYAKKFPTLPSLPKMLSSLSGRPIPFNRLIPSRDHRGAYLDILAWLLRYGWVTQLRTFGVLKVTREIKQKVAREKSLQHESDQGSSQAPSSKVTSTQSSTGLNTVGHSNDATVPSSTAPTSTSPATIVLQHPRSTPNAAGISSATIVRSESEFFEDSFILEPQQASGIESTWIEMINREQQPDIAALFDRILKYLNGQHALEKIEVREGISRKDLKRVLHAMEKYIVIVRHW